MGKINLLGIILILLIINVSVKSQEVKRNSIFKGDTINCQDSLGNKIGLWILFDVDSVKYKEVVYSDSGDVSSVKLFKSDGKEISEYIENTDTIIANRIKKKIKSNFNWKNINPPNGQGVVFVFIVSTCQGEIMDVRLLQGIHPSFNNEIKRATKQLEEDIICLCPNESKVPILIILPIEF